jgi:hypothetical protein
MKLSDLLYRLTQEYNKHGDQSVYIVALDGSHSYFEPTAVVRGTDADGDECYVEIEAK